MHTSHTNESHMADAEPTRVATRRDYPSSFTYGLLFYDFVSVGWAVLLMFYYALVHTDLYFTDGTSITVSNIPFYNYPGLQQSVSRTEKFSFNWMIWASDALRVLPPILYAIAVKEAVFFRTRSVITFYSPLMSILMLVDVAKAIYFGYWLFFQCVDYPFCIQHDPSVPHDQAQLSFIFAIVAAVAFAIADSIYMGLPLLIRRAGLPYVRIGERQSPKTTPRLADFVNLSTTLLPAKHGSIRRTKQSLANSRVLPMPPRR